MVNRMIESETEQAVEARIIHVGERPISFDRFVEIAERSFVELEQGIIVEKPMIHLDHELCSGWLYQVIGPYVQERELGRMLGSRIMVKTDDFAGRMPICCSFGKSGWKLSSRKRSMGHPTWLSKSSLRTTVLPD